jgi:nucleoside-triphosphatase THEP1
MVSRSREENILLELLLNGKRLLIISGEVNSGKTSAIEKIILLLQSLGKKVVGVYSKGIFFENTKIGFNLININSGDTKQIASIKPDDDFIFNQGRYYFNEIVFNEFSDYLLNSPASEFIIIDEVGPLEILEKGFYNLLKSLIDNYNGKIILVIRKRLFVKVKNKFNINSRDIDLFEIN